MKPHCILQRCSIFPAFQFDSSATGINCYTDFVQDSVPNQINYASGSELPWDKRCDAMQLPW